MKQTPIQLPHKTATGYELSLGPVNLVFAITETGMVACGALDVVALERFNYPAVKVKAKGTSIATVDDLLAGEVREVNHFAQQRGIKAGMSGREALEKI